MTSDKWDTRFLEMAAFVSTFSKDPNTQMGAVIVSEDRRQIAIGYNGFPRGIADDERLGKRDLKRTLMVHAETNAVLNCAFDTVVVPATLYVTGHPCLECAKVIVQKRLRRVVYRPFVFVGFWHDSMLAASRLFEEAGIEAREIKAP